MRFGNDGILAPVVQITLHQRISTIGITRERSRMDAVQEGIAVAGKHLVVFAEVVIHADVEGVGVVFEDRRTDVVVQDSGAVGRRQ